MSAVLMTILVALPISPGTQEGPKPEAAPRFFVVSFIGEQLATTTDGDQVVEVELEEVSYPKGPSELLHFSRIRTMLRDTQAQDTRAADEISALELQKRLKVGDVVLMASNHRPIAARYTRVLKEDVVVLPHLFPASANARVGR